MSAASVAVPSRAPASATRWVRARAALRALGLEHGAPLLVYAALTVGLTWPMAQHFTSAFTSTGEDARSSIWILWHVQQTALGREPLYRTPLLYYPVGASTATHNLGVLMGVLALPLWAWGPEAAYNGVLFISHWLTGYCMYLLARGLGFDRGIALFAGFLLMMAPIRLIASLGHLDRVFMGFLPLGLLALQRALDPWRSAWWTAATAAVLLLTLLHSPLQFMFVLGAVGFFLAASWLAAIRTDPWPLLGRSILLAAASLVLVGPSLLAFATAARDPRLSVDLNYQSVQFSPDLVQFFVPGLHSMALRLIDTTVFAGKLHFNLESAVFLTWTGLSLCVLAAVRAGRPARRWLLFTLVSVVLALGPFLKLYGQSRFTEYDLPIILPYAFLTALPGLEFLRTPGRFMLIGMVGLSVAASFGLAWLVRQYSPFRYSIIAAAIALVAFETWPQPWPGERLRPVPEFYRQIAQEDELYGVFDLPIRRLDGYYHFDYYANYQMYQMTHRKGIASGHIARTYTQHPLFPCLMAVQPIEGNLSLNGEPVNCYADGEAALERHGYRYVVWHKPRAWDPAYRPGPPSNWQPTALHHSSYAHEPGSYPDISARAALREMFGERAPLVDDDLVRVYAVQPPTDPPSRTTITFGDNWRPSEGVYRWGTSPATLEVASPTEQVAWLQITPHWMYDPPARTGLGSAGVLRVSVGDQPETAVEVAAGRTATVPLSLEPGRQTITLELEAGNFRPSDFGSRDQSVLSFAIRSIDLQTGSGPSPAGSAGD